MKRYMRNHLPKRSIAGLDSAGFTLFETLAATMILAIALVVVMQLFSGGLRANAVSHQYTVANFHAREKMEELLLSPVLADSQLNGEWEDGYTWQAVIARQQTEDAPPAKARELFTIDLKVAWQDGIRHRDVVVSSVALAQAAPATGSR